MFKIYFGCSIAGGRDNASMYPGIVQYLKKYGEVLTEIFSNGDIFNLDRKLEDTAIFERDASWMDKSNVAIFEVSTPSLGVGYEIRDAEAQNKDTLCLYKNQESKKLSPMISGNTRHKKLTVKKYNSLEEACSYIDEFFSKLS